jgi:diguanylate cyclase (GGDEF)-like protein
MYTRIASFAGMYLLAGFGTLAIGLPLWWRMRKQVEYAQDRLTRLAHYDSTTGQLNRNAFNRDLARCVETCPPGSRLGLMILDIDDFKDINDRFGHHTGDDLLNQFAARLGSIARSSDGIYRLGGDEFAVLVQPVESLEDVESIAVRLFAPFRTPIVINGHRLQASFSAGISLYPDDARDLVTLIAHADAAMYHAKRRGKNMFQRFEPRMTESTLRRLRLQEDLRESLATGESLELAYQPQFGHDGITVEGMEALMRWTHPEFGPISPVEFIPLAEDCGLIVPLGHWVLRNAIAQAARWHREGHDGLRIAVNMSVRQMGDGDLLHLLDHALAHAQLRPSALEFEITESLLLEDAEANIRFMHALRDRGIALAIDDFGKGYSSMSYLQRLPVTRLKIDMGFVHDIPGGGEAITTAIIAMAHSLALTVVAEGVETTEQLDFLRSVGCDGLQGFLLSAPLAAHEAGLLLDERSRRPLRNPGPQLPRPA